MRVNRLLLYLTILLLGGVIFFAFQYSMAQNELKATAALVKSQQQNAQALNFLQMFIKQVIKSDKEVSFETRLKLENAVRDMADPQVLAQWQKFVNSQNEVEAQKNVKDLLEVLVDKIKK